MPLDPTLLIHRVMLMHALVRVPGAHYTYIRIGMVRTSGWGCAPKLPRRGRWGLVRGELQGMREDFRENSFWLHVRCPIREVMA